MFLQILSYPRSILALILFPIHTFICCAFLVFSSIAIGHRKTEDFIVKLWGRGACKLFGVKVHVFGLDNIPNGGCVFAFNHTSFFDIYAMSGYLDSFRFGAKIELFKIPLFGAAMKRAGVLPIARDRREEVFKVYKKAEERIQRGERFALAPEGTRQITEKLGKFKSGPFIFAINAKAPIVPVVIKGAAAILGKGHFIPNWGVWSRDIHIHILPAVNSSDFSLETRPSMQEKVFHMMENCFD